MAYLDPLTLMPISVTIVIVHGVVLARAPVPVVRMYDYMSLCRIIIVLMNVPASVAVANDLGRGGYRGESEASRADNRDQKGLS